MILHNCIQGDPAWQQLRAGKPTASEFKRILTPGGKVSAQADEYMHRLLAERILGYPLETITTKAMETGREREPEAANQYDLENGIETEVIGIVFTDDMRIGASPDRFVGEAGLLEIKCPSPPVHCGYLLNGIGASADYYPQIMGQIWVAERIWLDSVSYCHGFPSAVFRVHRDTEYIAKLVKAVTEFADQLDVALQRLLDLGCKLAEPQEVRVAEDYLSKFGVTDQDVTEILAGKGMA